MQENHTPANWGVAWIAALSWPAVVAAAFWVGGYVERTKKRAQETEARVKSLVERHMPAIHNALAELRGLLLRGK